eukprot:gene19366-25233_t
MSTSFGPFPDHILREIRQYPGNSKCCDCLSLDTDWGNVNHGTLICLDCAGKHRSLGVHVSFIRSLYMDTWNSNQIAMMRYGGNGQIREFFKKLKIENSAINVLYMTKGAAHYRERLKERVEKILSGAISPPDTMRLRTFSNDGLEIAKTVSTDSNDHNKNEKTIRFDCSFDTGPMGLTLTKDFKNSAVVSKIVKDGVANSNGVEVGDLVIGIMGKSMNDYDEIMHMILCMPRPIKLTFSRIVKLNKPHLHVNVSNNNNSQINKPITPSNKPTTPVNISQKNSPVNNKPKPKSKVKDVSSDDDDDSVHISTTKLKKMQIFKSSLLSTNESTKSLKFINKDENNHSDLIVGKDVDSNSNNSIRTDNSHVNDSQVEYEHTEEVSNEICNKSIDENNFNDLPVNTHQISREIEIDNTQDNSTDEIYNHSEIITNESIDSNVNTDITTINLNEVYENEIEDAENEDDDEDEDEDDDDKPTLLDLLKPGVAVQVMRKKKWRSAIIKKIHSDGTFKVTYTKDGLSESHVALNRIGLTEDLVSQLQGKPPINDDNSNNNTKEIKKQQKQIYDNAFNDSMQPHEVINNNEHATNNHEIDYFMSGLDTDMGSAMISNNTNTNIAPSSMISCSSYNNIQNSSTNSVNNNNKGTYAILPSQYNYPTQQQLSDEVEEDSFALSPTNSLDEWIDEDVNIDKITIKPEINYKTRDRNKLKMTLNEETNSNEFRVVFRRGPLGLTLTNSKDNRPEVTKVKSDGYANSLGIMVGDIVIGIDGETAKSYEEIMTILPTKSFPLVMKFQRGMIHQIISQTGESFVKGTQLIANTVIDSVNQISGTATLTKSLLDTRLEEKVSNRTSVIIRESHNKSTNEVPPGSNMSTKKLLSPDIANPSEYDVKFEEGDLGVRLEETFLSNGNPTSVVVNITQNSQAMTLGVTLKSFVVGVNGECYISHAHTIASLKHSKRPILVRFNRGR